MFHGVAHTLVAVGDLAAGAERYTALLGRAPEPQVAEPPPARIRFRLANAGLELRASPETEGLVALGFAAEDVDACAAALAERGVAVEARSAVRGFDLPLAATRGLRMACVATSGNGTAPVSEKTPQALRSSARSEAQPSVVTGLDHVVVLSSDLDAARALYADVLGLRLALDRRFETRGLHILFFRVGGVTVEVAGRLDASGDADAADRFGGLAWRVGDTDAARERVAAAGFEVSPARAGAKPGTRVCSVRSGTCGVPTLLIGPER